MATKSHYIKGIANSTSKKIVIGIVLAILIAIVAWYFYQPKRNILPQDSTVSRTNLIEVPELGIMFYVSDDIADLTYTVKSLGDFGKAAFFSTKSLSAKDTHCNANYQSLGAIAVLTEKEWVAVQVGEISSTTPTFDPAHYDRTVKLGDNTYLLYETPGKCSIATSVVAVQKKQSTSLLNSLSTLQLQ